MVRKIFFGLKKGDLMNRENEEERRVKIWQKFSCLLFLTE
jgi:hypothetical protein